MFKEGDYKREGLKKEAMDRINFIYNQITENKLDKKKYFDHFGYPDEKTFKEYGEKNES